MSDGMSERSFGQLLCHDRLQVADGAQLNQGNLLDFLDVCIRDLSTSDDYNPEAHSMFLPGIDGARTLA